VRGTATIGINVLAEKGSCCSVADDGHPARNQAELTALLRAPNYLRTEEAAFAIDRRVGARLPGRGAALRSSCSASDEFCELLDAVARIADEWDESLRSQFGNAYAG